MRYLWVAAIGVSMASLPAAAKPPALKVPVPSEFPTTMPVPPPVPPVIMAPPPPAPPMPYPSAARPPMPRGNPGYWVSTNDYPAEALREEVTGITAFRVIVGTDGRVSECQITMSSGSTLLDSTTCTLVTRRARFTPATDSNGHLAIGAYSNRIRWVIPVELPPEPGTVTATYIVNTDGDIDNCKVSGPGGEEFSGYFACPERTLDKPFKDGTGKPVARRVSTKFFTTIASAPANAEPLPPAARVWRSSTDLPVAGTRVTEAIVETDGTVSDCRIVKLVGPMAEAFKLGTNDCPKRFERGYAAANGQSVRTLLRMTETTVITPLSGKR